MAGLVVGPGGGRVVGQVVAGDGPVETVIAKEDRAVKRVGLAGEVPNGVIGVSGGAAVWIVLGDFVAEGVPGVDGAVAVRVGRGQGVADRVVGVARGREGAWMLDGWLGGGGEAAQPS